MHGRKESLHTLLHIRTSKLNAINWYAFFIFFKSERVKKYTLGDYGVGSFLPSKNLLFLAASLEAIFTTKNVLNYYLSLSFHHKETNTVRTENHATPLQPKMMVDDDYSMYSICQTTILTHTHIHALPTATGKKQKTIISESAVQMQYTLHSVKAAAEGEASWVC